MDENPKNELEVFKTEIIYVDDSKNMMYVLVEERSMFEYSIEDEKWIFLCKYEEWDDYSKSLGFSLSKKKRKKQ